LPPFNPVYLILAPHHSMSSGPPIATPGDIPSTGQVSRESGSSDNDVI
jgi:hypothetical protein